MNIKDLTISELLTIFPDGFTIGYSGNISKILLASSYFTIIAGQYPVAPSNGGYMVVEMVDDNVIEKMRQNTK